MDGQMSAGTIMGEQASKQVSKQAKETSDATNTATSGAARLRRRVAACRHYGRRNDVEAVRELQFLGNPPDQETAPTIRTDDATVPKLGLT